MRTITKDDDKMTLNDFMRMKPEAVSKVKFAEIIGAKKVRTGMSVIYIDW